MDSQQAKLAVINYLLFDKQFIACFTESFNNSDVLGVNRSFYTTEVEVKTRREDLLNELYTIEGVVKKDLEMKRKSRQRSTKWYKHEEYLSDANAFPAGPLGTKMFVPNYFYLAFPKELMDHRLHGLDQRYGIMIIENGVVRVEREAMKLNTFKITPEDGWKLTKKASWENYYLRKRLREGGVSDEVTIPNS